MQDWLGECPRKQRRYDETSDSSLQVIEDDEDEELNQLQREGTEQPFLTPPTSSSASLKQGKGSSGSSRMLIFHFSIPFYTDAISSRPPPVESTRAPEYSRPLAPSEQGSPLRPSSRSNHTASNLASTKPPGQARPQRGESEVISRRQKTVQRIFTMPVPSRKNTVNHHASPKKKQRIYLDLE